MKGFKTSGTSEKNRPIKIIETDCPVSFWNKLFSFQLLFCCWIPKNLPGMLLTPLPVEPNLHPFPWILPFKMDTESSSHKLKVLTQTLRPCMQDTG